ncbi:MAG: hypothetical protein WC980_05015 [Candidatus Brocadiia bacterium]
MNNRGLANWILIIITAFAIIGLFITYILSGEEKNIDAQIQAAQAAQAEAKKQKEAFNSFTMDISPLIMSLDPGIPLKPEDMDKYIATKKKKTKPSKGAEELKMEKIVREAIDRATETRIRLERATYEKETAARRSTGVKDFVSVVKEAKEGIVAGLKTQISDMNDKLSSETEKYNVLKDKLTSAKKEQEDKLPKMQSQFEMSKTKMENDIALIKYNLEELATKEVFNRDIVETHGKIIQPNVNNRFAFITLGNESNIKLGWKFMVFRRDKTGIREWKGQVEVKKIYETQSLVSITALKNPMDPITEGDSITNIFYHPLGARNVVLIGKFERGDFKYDKAEVERRLTDISVTVEKKVSLKTDFVIIGKDPEETDIDRNNYVVVKTMNIPRLEGTEAREALEFYLGD